MGHGKASPRQKMINMMYLVLTALLALNVSADILNAFVLIDSSLRTSKESVEDKIDASYQQFVNAEVENPVKVKPWREKAEIVIEKADNLVEKIHELQVRLVQTADGPEGDPHHISKKDNTSVGGQVMVLEGGGEELKTLINEYRTFLIEQAGGDSTSLAKSFRAILNTDAQKGSHGDEEVPWITANFEHLPLIAVVTLMTKMQADVRNAESNMLNHLLTEIDAGTLKFDKIAGIVSAPNSYLAVGEQYEAEIFTAAYESTKDPIIYILSAPFDSAKYASGGYKDLTPLDSTQIKDGKGIITRTGGSAGTSNIYGYIDMKMPSGVFEPYPFESKYQVVVPSFAVSPTKMNVFYIGVKNPVDISASGVRGDVSASISNGSITPQGGGSYIVNVRQVGDVTVTVNGDGNRLGSKQFRCKTVPDPSPTVGGKRGGNITKASLKAQNYVMASLDNFVFDLKFPVTSFSVSVTVGAFTEDIPTTGAQIKPNQKALFNDIKRGSKVYFENIKARAPDGSIRDIGSVAFTIQ